MKDQRIKEVQDYILQHESVSLKELCDVFNISINTVRRYVNEIAKSTTIKKVYGGVRVQSPVSVPSTFSERHQTRNLNKQQIAQKAAGFIHENDIIFIDSGTTTMHLIDYIPEQLHITVITNSYHIIRASINRPEITLITLPGILDRRTLSFSSEDNKFLDTLNIHKAFMACTGLSINDGATNSFPAEYSAKKTAVRKANQVFLMVDSSKFGISTLMTFCPLNEIHYVITDKMPSSDFIEAVSAAGHQIVLSE